MSRRPEDLPAAAAAGPANGQDAAARAAVDENPAWYHTIELAPGVVTPGRVDHRGVADEILPDDLSGLRALDVGTFDGFWAFEMERRGAEVVAIDVESIDRAQWPPSNRERLERMAREMEVQLGLGFRLASTALRSRVTRVICEVHDLTAEAIGGKVDFVFSGAILVHLRDPVGALERIHGVLDPGGELRLMEPFSFGMTWRSRRRPAARFQPMETPFNWWLPNLAALRVWPRAAGFQRTRRIAVVRPPALKRMRQRHAVIACDP